jgi:WD40 repeat protein
LKALLIISLVLFCTSRATAAPVSFSKEVAPFLVAKCLACHNSDKAKGRYRLHTFEALMQAGASKEVPVVAGKPEQSLLFRLVISTDEDERMPQSDEPLAAEQVALLRRWIQEGARFDGTSSNTPLALLAPPTHPTAPRAYPVPVAITALAFSPDGAQLVASGYHEVTVWSSDSGTLLRRIGNIAERTFDLAYSPDGQWLASASGTPAKLGEVKLLPVSGTNALPRTLATLPDAALCVAFSLDGQHIAAGGADNVVRIWNLASNAAPIVIEQNADWVMALAFSPDGRHLAAGGRDKAARVFLAASGELDETYTGHTDYVLALAWADNASVLTASRTRNVHRWNIKDAKRTAELGGWENDPVKLVCFETNLFSASLDGSVRQHSLESKRVVRVFEPKLDAPQSLAWHTPTRRLAVGAHDGTVCVWSATNGGVLTKFTAAPGMGQALSRRP